MQLNIFEFNQPMRFHYDEHYYIQAITIKYKI